MDQESTIINRVAGSGILTIDLETFYPNGERVVYDLKDNLFQGLILKEKDFRDFLKENDWSRYAGKNVAITCSTDAIIPAWAYMLLMTKLQPFAQKVILGSPEELEKELFAEVLNKIDYTQYKDAKVVIKGCSDKPVPASAYLQLTNKLLPYASSIMYGEPCSTVPVYKKAKG